MLVVRGTLQQGGLALGAEPFAALMAEGRRARTGAGTGRFRRAGAQLAANAANPRYTAPVK